MRSLPDLKISTGLQFAPEGLSGWHINVSIILRLELKEVFNCLSQTSIEVLYQMIPNNHNAFRRSRGIVCFARNVIFTRKYIEPWEKNDFRQSAYLDFL